MNVTPQLTNAGWELLTRAIGGETITFTGMKVGDGSAPSAPADLTDLVSEVYAFGIDEINTSVSQQVSVKGEFDSSEIPYDFYFRECGLFCAADAVKTFAGTGSQTAFVLDAVTTGVYPYTVKEVKVDGTSTTAYTYNASTGTVTFTTAPASGAVIVVDALEANLLYAYLNAGQEAGLVEKVTSLPREFVINMAVVVGEAANVTALLTTAEAYASQEDLDTLADLLTAHVNRRDNPHVVTAAQLGLDNVAAPTYTPGTASTPLASGEALATALGKIAGHIADKNNPHEVKVADLAGVLPITKGGTNSNGADGKLSAFWNTLLENAGGGKNLIIGYYIGNGARKRKLGLSMGVNGLGFIAVMPWNGDMQSSGAGMWSGIATDKHQCSGRGLPLPTGSDASWRTWDNTYSAILIDTQSGDAYVGTNYDNAIYLNNPGYMYLFIAVRGAETFGTI